MAVIYACPADKRLLCPWEGYASDIKHHFEKEHSTLLYNTSSIQIDLNTSSENFLMSRSKEELYLVQAEIKDDILILRLRYMGSAAEALKKFYDIALTVSTRNYEYRASNKIVRIVWPTTDGWQINLPILRELHDNLDTITCAVLIQNREETQDPQVTKQESFKRIRINNSFIEGNVCDEVEENYLDALSILDQKIAELTRERDNGDIMDRISYLNFSMLEENLPRSRPHSIEDIKCPELFDGLPEITEEFNLNCTSCNGDMLPPIYLCINGHSVCISCRSTNCKCCGGSITEVRNTELENVSRTHTHACRYAPSGCMEKLPYNELRGHETKCRFCKYRCFSECGFEHKFPHFVNHLKIQHGSIRISYQLVNEFPKDHEFFIVSKDRGIFHCRSEEKDDLITWRATFFGPKERRFFCELTFKGSKTKEPHFLKRRDNVYELSKTRLELKKMKAKEKYTVLIINSYDN